jgi:hypothetical protein
MEVSLEYSSEWPPAATAVSTIFYIDCDDGNSEIIEVTACTP